MTTMIELSQLGSVGLDVNTNLFVHKDPLSYNKDQNVAKIIDDLVSKLESKHKFHTRESSRVV